MYLEYECAKEAVSMLGGCADGLLEILDEHTTYARPSNPQWEARLAKVRELANQLRAETNDLWEEWARATGEIS